MTLSTYKLNGQNIKGNEIIYITMYSPLRGFLPAGTPPPPKKKKTHRVVSSNHWRGEARGNRPTILPLNSRIVIASMASRSLYTLWSCLRSCAALLCWQIGCGSRIPGRLAGCKGHIWFLGFAYQGSPNMVHSDHLYDQWTGHGGVSVSWNHSQGFHQGHSALCLWPPT